MTDQCQFCVFGPKMLDKCEYYHLSEAMRGECCQYWDLFRRMGEEGTHEAKKLCGLRLLPSLFTLGQWGVGMSLPVRHKPEARLPRGGLHKKESWSREKAHRPF